MRISDWSSDVCSSDLLAAVGWSLGANVLLKALGEMGANAPIEAAAAASAPFVLEACAHKLDSGFSRVYQRRLLRDLKQMVCRKYPPLVAPQGVDLLAMRRARNFIEFDDAYTAPRSEEHTSELQPLMR